LTVGTLAPAVLIENKEFNTKQLPVGSGSENDQVKEYTSNWKALPNMIWTGEELWAQRLQDWSIQNGELVCGLRAPNRTVHLLTHQLSARSSSFQTSITIRFGRELDGKKGGYAGFRIGARGTFADYRSAVMTGKGLNVGIYTNGSLFIGQTVSSANVTREKLTDGVKLVLTATTAGADYVLKLEAFSTAGKILASVVKEPIAATDLTGNIALVSHFEEEDAIDKDRFTSYSNWQVEGDKLNYHPKQVYGPVYFAQYTINDQVLKLSAQLAPVNLGLQNTASLEINTGGVWRKIASVIIHPRARVASFRVEGWRATKPVSYRVLYEIESKDKKKLIYHYEGTIAAEPVNKAKEKALVCSCNGDMGFPDNDIVQNAVKHDADLVMFLGDQYYERNGDFGIQTDPLDKAELDCLRKWIQFGWSYRDLFRHIPSICLPDDHDVFHGNVWGSGGRAAIVAEKKNERQDSGGYIMPAEWVNMAQICQTSHMPDPYDPAPVQQGISVYYTHWQYGGISFGIIEDRKFKSAPKEILPPEADVFNGYAQNQHFDIRNIPEPSAASLIGDRQIKFLEEWTKDWSKGTQFKVLASATPFICLQTLPKGSLNDQVTSKLAIPEKGVYVTGDVATRDMDTDGWPHNRRDEVVRLLRKGYAFHLTGDQHIGSVVHYGVDDHADSGFVFTAPALGNVFPRRWWPALDEGHTPLEGQPAYTGNFQDGFGNKLTVHAVANPFKTGKAPSVVYDRATGYGVATFDKETRNITLECWPRYVDPVDNPKGQYTGWPVTINQLDNYNRKPAGYLPQLTIIGIENPVIQLIRESNNEIEYTIRIKGNEFRPKVFEDETYTIVVSDMDAKKEKYVKGLSIRDHRKEIKIIV